jgi:phosphoribosylformylglycinamidine synthase
VKAHIHITLKDGVLDPQGKAIQQSLVGLGFDTLENLRQGKYIDNAHAKVTEMCEKLLANTVIENYEIKIIY